MTDSSRARVVRHHTALLAIAQASIWLTAGVFVAAGPIAAARLTGHASLSGLMFALWALAFATGAQVTGLAMDRFGRRPGLAAAHGLLCLGSLAAAFSVLSGSAAGLLGASVIGGFGMGSALLSRGAVADMYPPQRRGVAVGYLLAAGTVGAIGGPQLVNLARALTTSSALQDAFARSWFVVAATSLVAFACMLLLSPDPRDLAPRPSGSAVRRPLASLLKLAPIRAAVLAMAAGQTAMYSIMGISAVAYARRGVEVAAIAVVLSSHFAGMFAFSPVWGAFLDRRGRKRGLVTAGTLLFVGAGITGIASHPILSGLGLFLVGLGWSGLYLGVTAVVSDFTSPSERGAALGFTDFASASISSIGALIAGILLDGPGFGAVGIVMMAVLLPTIAAVGLVGGSRWRPVALKPA